MRFSSYRLAAACVVALLSAAVPASAEEPAQPAATTTPAAPTEATTQTAEQPAAPAENPDEVICKKLPAETGTRLARQKKECHTRREWNEIAEAAKQTLEKAQD
jgi:hypothetical protein